MQFVDDDDGVEQGRSPTVHGRLHLGEGRVLMGALVDLLPADPVEQAADGGRRIGGDPHRWGVDEEPDRAVAAGQARPAAAARGAEHDVARAGEGRQDETPCRLDQHSRRDALRLTERVDRLTQCRCQPKAIGTIAEADIGQWSGTLQRDESGRLVEAVQQFAEIAMRRLPVRIQMLLEPEHVIFVWTTIFERRFLTTQAGVVGLEHLLDHPHHADVEQRVVVGEHDAVLLVGQPKKVGPPQRRLVEREALPAVLDQEGFQPTLLLRRR